MVYTIYRTTPSIRNYTDTWGRLLLCRGGSNVVSFIQRSIQHSTESQRLLPAATSLHRFWIQMTVIKVIHE